MRVHIGTALWAAFATVTTFVGCEGVVHVRATQPPPPSVQAQGAVVASAEPVAPPTAGDAPAAGPVMVARESGGALALGENHTCMVTDGRVRCWGYNKQSSLGVGSAAEPGDGFVDGIGTGAPIRQLVAGGYQTCALTEDEQVWCWGSNHLGQAGVGEVSKSPVTRPQRVRGLSGVRRLSAGDATTCALSNAGQVSCWGSNSHHQISRSSSKAIATPTVLERASGIEQVAIGNYHLCLLRAGRVECRGELEGYNQQLAALQGVTEISAGWGHSCALAKGSVYCWGSNYGGVLGLGKDANPPAAHPPTPVPGVSGAERSLVGSDYHSCVILTTGEVACWGSNQGHSFSEDLPAEPYQKAQVLHDSAGVEEVKVGGVHTCVVRGGRPECWGNDWAGAVRGAARR